MGFDSPGSCLWHAVTGINKRKSQDTAPRNPENLKMEPWKWWISGRYPMTDPWGIVYLPTFTIKNQLNVGKYTIHGWYGPWKSLSFARSRFYFLNRHGWVTGLVIYFSLRRRSGCTPSHVWSQCFFFLGGGISVLMNLSEFLERGHLIPSASWRTWFATLIFNFYETSS